MCICVCVVYKTMLIKPRYRHNNKMKVIVMWKNSIPSESQKFLIFKCEVQISFIEKGIFKSTTVGFSF